MTDELRPVGWSDLTFRVLRYAAWSKGRSVPVAKWEDLLRARGGFEMHEAARRFLAEFGGLRTDEWTPGPMMPQSPFRFDPSTAAGESETFARLSAEAGTYLYPIGQADSGDSYLGMAANGAVYIGKESVELLADTAYEAMEKLVMERRTDAPLPFVPAGDHLVLPHSPDHELSAEIGTRWSAETDRVLRMAGWRPGRSVSTEEWERVLHESDEDFTIHEAARRFLTEFGGLEINQKGPGRTMHRSPFRLDPLVAKWDFELIDLQSEEVGTYLYPLGDSSNGNFYLTMAANGAVYMGLDYVNLLADTADEALEKLIVGIR
ncbi:SUKH-3 domain-containing protein [Streptomyces sp. H10-C2]|uniref:SUKH-3 domain-containing protein n=1 Tax=unclassified Streptomyces TaxID=2593676 RepID=UPI0024BBB972|nr:MULTISPECIES: SUKH-3 domain-containing protein [unclassified Streptomyces]MDJ0340360.1 SUKH-3 domain-containing protein [Streptomyces sp. PH10-H1]MDJ0368192.1 SUKH-3 domain-containing protein [Streptomyces sp. H10-C2]